MLQVKHCDEHVGNIKVSCSSCSFDSFIHVDDHNNNFITKFFIRKIEFE